MSENENYTLSEQDQADLASLTEEPLDRTVLEIWEEVLSNIETMEREKIEPGYASMIVGRWPKLEYRQIADFYALFMSYLRLYREALHEQIRLHPDAKTNIAPVGDEKSDAIANREIYKELMFQWNLVTARVEHVWDSNDPLAGEKIAAMAEAQNFVTGGQGMMQALTGPQVGFEWTDEDQIALQERVVQAAEEL